MPQVIEFPHMAGDARATLLALARIGRETPAPGQSFRELRSRLRAAKLWDRERPTTVMRVLGVSGATIAPSPFMNELAATRTDDEALAVIADRLLELNPLLFKTVWELLAQRAHNKDELSKQLSSFAYRGKVPSRPDLENFYAALVATGVARVVGIALVHGPAAARHAAKVAALDIDELLENDVPIAEPVIPDGDDDATPAVVAGEAHAPAAATTTPTAVATVGLPSYLRHLTGGESASPRATDRGTSVSRFQNGFSDELLAETTRRIGEWHRGADPVAPPYQPADFGFDAEMWIERADELLYRIAVAAALVFRLEAERDVVLQAYRALDTSGVLTDLYHGTVPERLPDHIDARALMLASLAARRCAESPELAASLDQQTSAGEAFLVLDAALGRGLFRMELFWIVGMLGNVGVVRWADLGELSALPHRMVRDTLFRLGYLATPYGPDAPSLVVAARAARRAAGADPAHEILIRFALAAGCAFDCPHRKICDVPCRERLES